MIRLREILDKKGISKRYVEKNWLKYNLEKYQYSDDDIMTFSTGGKFICKGLNTESRPPKKYYISEKLANQILSDDIPFDMYDVPKAIPKSNGEDEGIVQPILDKTPKNAVFDELEKLREYVKSVEKDVLFAKAVRTSPEAISVTDFVKILVQNGKPFTQHVFFKYLHENGWLEDDGVQFRNVPTIKAIESGYFRLSEVAISVSNGNTHLSISPRITGEGQAYFLNLFLKGDSIESAKL